MPRRPPQITPQIFWGFIFLAIISIFYRPIETGDSWWHLSTGRWISQHRAIPHADPFTFTNQPASWTATHWLADLLFYKTYQLTGLPGLQLLRALILTLAILIFFLHARRAIPLPKLIILIFLLTFSLASRNLLRPLIFNFPIISGLLVLLFKYQSTGRRRYLIPIPLINILWTNIHLGNLVYGIPIIICFLIANLLPPSPAANHSTRAKHTRDLALTLLATLAAFAATPYGVDGMLYPFQTFLQPTFRRFYEYRGIISETQSPLLLLTPAQWTPLALTALLTVTAIARAAKNRPLAILLFLYSGALFAIGIRAVGYFTIICATIIAETQPTPAAPTPPITPSTQRRHTLLLLTAIALLVGKAVLAPAAELPPPDQALAELRQRHLTGRVFNTDNLGGYLIWTSYPALRPFLDGRHLDLPRLQQYLQILAQPRLFWAAADQTYQFDIILIDPTRPNTQKFLTFIQGHPNWQTLYAGPHTLLLHKITP